MNSIAMTSLDRFQKDGEQQRLYGAPKNGADRAVNCSTGPIGPVPQDWAAGESRPHSVVVVSLDLVVDPETGELKCVED